MTNTPFVHSKSNALDYLLKPFSDERMEATLARVRARLTELQAGEFGQSVLRMLTTTSTRGPYLDRLVLKSIGATHFVRVAEIDWIEAAGVSPAMPSVAQEIWRRIGLAGAPNGVPFDQVAIWGLYPGGVVEKGTPLFPRITSDE